MQVVDLFGREHGLLPFIRRKPNRCQNVVVGKIRSGGRGAAEVLPEPRLAPELSCCWQDAPGRRPPAKPVRRNALGRKLSCCWQDREASASDPGLAAVGGCVRRWPDCSAGAGASTRDCGPAICGSYPDKPAGIPDPRRSCGGDIGAPPPLALRLAANGLPGLILRWLKNLLTIATTPFDHTGVVALKGQAKNLETFVELVLPPRRWRLQPQNR